MSGNSPASGAAAATLPPAVTPEDRALLAYAQERLRACEAELRLAVIERERAQTELNAQRVRVRAAYQLDVHDAIDLVTGVIERAPPRSPTKRAGPATT